LINKASTEGDGQLVWITSNIVKDSLIGNACYPLLCPAPLHVGPIVNPLYTTVKLNRFRHIEIAMYRDILRNLPYVDVMDIMLVLHFVPAKLNKRKLTYPPDDCSKRSCQNNVIV